MNALFSKKLLEIDNSNIFVPYGDIYSYEISLFNFLTIRHWTDERNLLATIFYVNAWHW